MIQLNPHQSEANKELIFRYKEDLEVEDLSPGRIYKLLTHLKVLGEHADFDFEEASLEDIKRTVAWINRRKTADATKKDYKTALKQFYKWLNGGNYPREVEWIRTTRKRSNNTLPKDV